MLKCNDWPIGICSWCAGNDIEILDRLKNELGLEYIHLHITPALTKGSFAADFIDHGWKVSCTMIDFVQEDYSTIETITRTGGIIPDEFWKNNCQRILDAINITADLHVKYLSFHAGFIESDIEKMRNRMILLADMAEKRDVILLMETGQESTHTLKHFLEQLAHPAIGVNFDPANMILYNTGKPVEAVMQLAPWIKHVHIKDATRSKVSGQWGLEVPWGDGQVGANEFLKALEEIDYSGIVAIEREVGKSRNEDIKLAIKRLS